MSVEQFSPPCAVNMRRGVPVWEVLGSAGIGSTIIRCPVTYPPDAVRGTMLSGMGVPDLRGGLGTPPSHTSAESVRPRESENVVRVSPGSDGKFETYLIGRAIRKTDPTFASTSTSSRSTATCVAVRFSAGSPSVLQVREGGWSDSAPRETRDWPAPIGRGLVPVSPDSPRADLRILRSPVNFVAEALFSRSVTRTISPERAGSTPSASTTPRAWSRIIPA